MIYQYCPNFLSQYSSNEHKINRAAIKIEVVILKTTQKIPLFFHNRIRFSFLSCLNLILDPNISIQYVLKNFIQGDYMIDVFRIPILDAYNYNNQLCNNDFVNKCILCNITVIIM